MIKNILIICSFAFLVSCGGNKKVITSSSGKHHTARKTVIASTPTPKSTSKVTKVTQTTIKTTNEDKPLLVLSYSDRVQRYVNEFSEIAMSEMKTYGIPASITLAQGILESGAGYGDLTQRAKNHFGIKCHDWTGDRVYHDDDRSQECFRKYTDASKSFRDHSLFLKNRKRYSRLFTFSQKDYKSWARGLREAGYATDKKYPQKLIAIIEKYGLSSYDYEVLGQKTKKTVTKGGATRVVGAKPLNTKGHVVAKGDTLYSISKKYKISVEELKMFNNLLDNTITVGQVLKTTATADEEEDFN
ncbi:glucosaminidase domain-containing protein [Aquimarina pacifica]|uniref:glucosaminidase domain-containing protein n=1 Tax=Aquimarina pacifica TaxID=1296415 RepID=UPI00046E7847|nr:glucosaminidase domain-containing protein [Aquimarina pacifica]